MEDAAVAEISITDGESGFINIRAHKYGSTPFVIKDGNSEYRYILEIYEDEGGHTQVDITKQE